MDWTQFIILIVTIASLFLWNRSEANDDRRHMDAKLESAISAMNVNVQAIQQEMKDFHGRLERQDAEFKTRIANLEEKRSSKK
jgi:hypothetical protein